MAKYKIKKIPANSISYDNSKTRDKKGIFYIVIHYTGNSGDTAEGNGLYFKNGNTRAAGAHFFVDKKGKIVKSINLNRTAWSVGGFFTAEDGAGRFYKKCTNSNSVSIELCDCVTNSNKIQEDAVKWLINYIKKRCPNANTVIRHWDVNGKSCPAPFTGENNKKWEDFKKKVGA